METYLLIYHVIVVLMSVILFSMKVTAPTAILKFILTAIVKLSSLYTGAYAVIGIFKIVEIL